MDEQQMEKAKSHTDQLWEAAKAMKGGIEEHRKLGHMAKAIRFEFELLKTQEVQEKMKLYKERMELQFKERYGEIEMK